MPSTWLRLAPARIGHLFPRLPYQSEYNRHLRHAAPLLAAAAGPVRQTPSWQERLRLMDGTPVRCGASRTTVHRSDPGEIAGYGMDKSHHAFYWGAELMLVTTAEGAVCSFSLAHSKELDERLQAVHLCMSSRPRPGRARSCATRGSPEPECRRPSLIWAMC
ncbi:hypothetical protein [Actinomadura sp. NPDC049753]|uniref:hypothetical protein n=1 Tax=Actinomadura sp. NPDC049753 TaxID=3154739 RepID=UPI00343760AA